MHTKSKPGSSKLEYPSLERQLCSVLCFAVLNRVDPNLQLQPVEPLHGCRSSPIEEDAFCKEVRCHSDYICLLISSPVRYEINVV